MTNIPDSGWLAIIQKIDWWIIASFAAASTVILLLAANDAPLFRQLSPAAAAIVGAVCVLFTSLLIFRLFDSACKAYRRRKESMVRKRIDRLSNVQKEQLTKVFSTGKRNFEIPAESGTPRWLEELEEWKYIEQHPIIVYTAGMPEFYSITKDGWKQLEKLHGKDI